MGEIWHDASQWLYGDEYDAVMNYPLTSGINDFFVDHKLTKKDRKEEPTFRSLYFHFPNEIKEERCIEYIKLDAEGRKIRVLLNASGKEINIKDTPEILFSRNFRNDILFPGGTLIHRMQ